MVFAPRPDTDADTATGLLPDPGSEEHGTLNPYDVEVPYSKWQSLTPPSLGLTVAFNVAEVGVTDDTAPVTTAGAFGSAVNVWSAPGLMPPELVETIRK